MIRYPEGILVKLSVPGAFVRKGFPFFTQSHKEHKGTQRQNFVFYFMRRNNLSGNRLFNLMVNRSSRSMRFILIFYKREI